MILQRWALQRESTGSSAIQSQRLTDSLRQLVSQTSSPARMNSLLWLQDLTTGLYFELNTKTKRQQQNLKPSSHR